MANKKDHLRVKASELFLFEEMSVRSIARNLNIHPNTVFRWKQEDHWDRQRTDFQLDPRTYHTMLLCYIQKMQNAIRLRNSNPFPSVAEAEQLLKMVGSLSALRTPGNLTLSDYIQVFNELIVYLRLRDFKQLNEVQTFIQKFYRRIVHESEIKC